MTANLEFSRLTNRPIILKRDNENHVPNNLVDILVAEKLVTQIIGDRNSFKGCASYFQPVPDFKSQLERARIRIQINDKHLFIELRDKEKNKIPISKTSVTISLNAPVLIYNKSWLDHTISLCGQEYSPFCKRIFNESLELGGRYYGTPIQQLPKTERTKLLIDGCETVELDYSALHPRILYSKIGIDYREDPYSTPDFSRNIMKIALLVLINSSDAASFKGQITSSSNPLNIQAWRNHKARYAAYEHELNLGRPAPLPKMPKMLEGFLKDFEDYKGEQVHGAGVYKSLCTKHHAIQHFFCNGKDNLGSKLQFTDSKIMSRIIELAYQHNIVLIPIHDSVICKISDAEQVYGFMIQAYNNVINANYSSQMGDLPTIKSNKMGVIN